MGRPTRLLRQVPQDSEPADSLDRRDVQQGVVVCRIGTDQHPTPEKSRIADSQHGAIGRYVVAVDAEVDDNPRKPGKLEGSCDRVDKWSQLRHPIRPGVDCSGESQDSDRCNPMTPTEFRHNFDEVDGVSLSEGSCDIGSSNPERSGEVVSGADWDDADRNLRERQLLNREMHQTISADDDHTADLPGFNSALERGRRGLGSVAGDID